MQSPEEKSKAMPSAAPSMKIWLYADCSAGSMSPLVEYWISPQLFDTTSARCLSTMFASAASRSVSKQEFAATVRTLASGARPCAMSTSSDSSP